MEITMTFHPWGLKITILGAKQVSRKMGAYQLKKVKELCKEFSFSTGMLRVDYLKGMMPKT